MVVAWLRGGATELIRVRLRADVVLVEFDGKIRGETEEKTTTARVGVVSRRIRSVSWQETLKNCNDIAFTQFEFPATGEQALAMAPNSTFRHY